MKSVPLTRKGLPDRRYGRTGPRPHLWKAGPNPEHRAQRLAWVRHGCQARYRGEPSTLTFADYCTIWGDRWSESGRTRGALRLVRIDTTQPWSLGNCRLAPWGDLGL